MKSTKLFAVAMVLVMALTTMGTTMMTSSASYALPARQETAVVGGSACSFGAGASIGLGVAGLLGCFVCGAGSLAIDVAEFIWC